MAGNPVYVCKPFLFLACDGKGRGDPNEFMRPSDAHQKASGTRLHNLAPKGVMSALDDFQNYR